MLAFPSAANLGLLLFALIGISIPLRMMAGKNRKIGLLLLSLIGISLIGVWTNGQLFAVLLLGVLLVFWLANWGLAFLIEKTSGKIRRNYFVFSITLNVLALVTLHYCDQQTSLVQWPWQNGTNGISLLYLLGAPFLLLNTLSYLWDVHHRRVTSNILDLGLHLFYLPKMPAGPVMSPRPFAYALARQPGMIETINDYGYGLMHIGFGLFSSEALCSFIIQLIMPVLKVSESQEIFGRSDALATVFGIGLAAYFALAGAASIGKGISLLFGIVLPNTMRKPLLAPNVIAFANCWVVGVAGILRRFILHPFEKSHPAYRPVLTLLCSLCGGILFGVGINHLLFGGFFAATILLFLTWQKWIFPHLAHFVPALQTEKAQLTRVAALSLVLPLLLTRSVISFVVLAVIIGSWYSYIKATKQTNWKEVFKTISAWVYRFITRLVTLIVIVFSATILIVPNMQALRSLSNALFCSEGLSIPTVFGIIIKLYKQSWIGMVFPVTPTESNNVLFYNQGTGILSLIFLFLLTFWMQKRPSLISRQATTWHSIAFGFSIYFLTAWYFVGSTPVWLGLWR